MEEAYETAKLSDHPRSKVGCVFESATNGEKVSGINYNPSNTDPDAVWMHAEASVISTAAWAGIAMRRGAMAVTWFPCWNCAILIASAGIRTLYYDKAAAESRWDDPKYNFQASFDYLQSQGVELVGM